MSESAELTHLRTLTENNLMQEGINILMLNIPATYKEAKDKAFNSKEVQACVEDSWRTSPEKLGRAKLILATVKNPGTKEYSRKIVGVFEYAAVVRDIKKNDEEYVRTHFVGVQPASEIWIEKFKGCIITGLNPRATNPLRYFLPNKHSK